MAAFSSIAAAGIGAAGSIAGGMMQGSGAEQAAQTSAQQSGVNAAALAAAGKQGDALLSKSGKRADKRLSKSGKSADRRLAAGYKGARKDLRPYDRLGMQGSNALANYLGFRPEGKEKKRGFGGYNRPYTQKDLMRDPVYQTELNENVRAWDQSAASRGSLMSGNTVAGLRELTAAGIQRGYDRDWNQRERQYNALVGLNNMGLGVRTGLANMGIQTAGARANAGLQVGANRANTGVQVGANRANTLLQGAGAQAAYLQQGADARGSGQMAQGNAMGNAFGNIGTMGMLYGAGAFENNSGNNSQTGSPFVKPGYVLTPRQNTGAPTPWR